MNNNDMNRLKTLQDQWISLKLENKYNVSSEISIKENSLNIYSNETNYLLVSMIPDINNEFRVYTDDEYLIIKSNDMINFLIEHFKKYFSF